MMAKQKTERTAEDGDMRRISIGKVVVNIGVGKSGEAVERARKVLEARTDTEALDRATATTNECNTTQREPVFEYESSDRRRRSEIDRELVLALSGCILRTCVCGQDAHDGSGM